MSDVRLLDTIRDWLKNTDPTPDTPYYRDTRQYIMELLDAYDALARQLAAMTALHLETCGDLRVAEAQLTEVVAVAKDSPCTCTVCLRLAARARARAKVKEA